MESVSGSIKNQSNADSPLLYAVTRSPNPPLSCSSPLHRLPTCNTGVTGHEKYLHQRRVKKKEVLFLKDFMGKRQRGSKVLVTDWWVTIGCKK